MSDDFSRQATKDAAFRAMYMIALMMSVAGICIFLNLGDFATYIGFADTMMRQLFGGLLIIMAAVEIFIIVPFLKRNSEKSGKENYRKK
ncbi:MAG: hypothetical protein RBR86_05145 [Pseudobdellovibrionaceae bacterium]|jgi:quinol-cytochrome oxidoreductase complex cytochrome b subunit|nr:hypothetical protein [Pseudobdellovibrionaceae bacterium]